MEKTIINGPFSIAMLNYQRVIFIFHYNQIIIRYWYSPS